VVAKHGRGGEHSLPWNWRVLRTWLVIYPNAKRRVITPPPCFAFTLQQTTASPLAKHRHPAANC
jgi:hypothetical protein